MNKFLYIGLGLIIGISGTFIYIQQSNTNMVMKKTQHSDTLDAHFIEQMIPHHEDAITMSQLALTHVQKPEVKELAQQIIDSQGKEIMYMKGIYKKWFGRDLPSRDQAMMHHGTESSTGFHMGIRGEDSDITKLTESENFDVAFLEHMIPHHQMAVMMASMVKDGTSRQEMKKLSETIVADQTREIESMRGWLKEWSK